MLPKLTFAHFAEKLNYHRKVKMQTKAFFHEVNKHTIVVCPIPNLI